MVRNFIKFPSTPHLAVLPGVSIRGDKVLDEEQRKEFLRHKLIVEEKIDGANLGISFDKGGNLLLQNRGGYLDKPFTGQWKKLPDWLHVKADLLFDALEDRLILFGEWCYARHSVSYSKLPSWFLGFDVLEKKTRNFWPVKKRDNLLKKAGIPAVPLLANGHFSFPELEELLACSKLSSEPAEGIYLRYERDGRLVSRAKLVRPAFIQAVNEHWSKSQIRPNTLVSGAWI
ncbi:MAG TPA: DNA ligase [Desulfobulbus sp.]|nr:DNA ligase [Desulfobulbus sp.]